MSAPRGQNVRRTRGFGMQFWITFVQNFETCMLSGRASQNQRIQRMQCVCQRTAKRIQRKQLDSTINANSIKIELVHSGCRFGSHLCKLFKNAFWKRVPKSTYTRHAICMPTDIQTSDECYTTLYPSDKCYTTL